jgi:hypothetical protein
MSATPSPAATSTASSSTSSSGSNQGSEGSLASSASLYLYTFLATLVLLLGVSAAIVVRSLVLRRRHRRMIEEAIRNGTYVPPNVLANSRGRIDLAKKPKMWEATLVANGGSKEGGWTDILPVSASISSSTPGTDISNNMNTSTSNTATGGTGGAQDAPRVGTLRIIARAPARIALGAFRLISPPNRTRPSSDPESNPIPPTNANSENKTRPPHQTLPASGTTTPTYMDVAVLIAMPGALSNLKHNANAEEEDLPHVEMGTAEIVITPTPSVQEGSSTSSSLDSNVEYASSS